MENFLEINKQVYPSIWDLRVAKFFELIRQGRQKVWQSGGGVRSKMVGIMCPPVEIGFTDRPTTGGGGMCPPAPLLVTALDYWHRIWPSTFFPSSLLNARQIYRYLTPKMNYPLCYQITASFLTKNTKLHWGEILSEYLNK